MEECRHIRVNGTKCRAAALTSNAWCFFHDHIYKERAAHPQPRVFTQLALPADTLDYGCVPVTTPEPQPQPQDLPIELPLIEDLSSIQLAISRILLALAANTIHPKRAGLMLYGLQIAAQNLPKRPLDRSDTVTDVAYTEDNIPFDATPFYAYKTISVNEEEEDAQDDIDTAEQEEDDDEEGDDEEEGYEEDDDNRTKTAETFQQMAARLKLILRRLDASADLRVPHPREATVCTRATREPLSSARPAFGPQARWWLSGGATSLACLLLVGLPSRCRAASRWLAMLLFGLVVGGVMGCGSSGGGGSKTNPDATPPGTYTVKLTATAGSGSGAISDPVAVTLTVTN